MKKIALIALFLVGCTAPRPYRKYECAILNGHGSYAHMYGEYQSTEEAEASAEKVRQNLVSKKLVPDNTGVMCYRDEKAN
jgi:hypothetical protein